MSPVHIYQYFINIITFLKSEHKYITLPTMRFAENSAPPTDEAGLPLLEISIHS